MSRPSVAETIDRLLKAEQSDTPVKTANAAPRTKAGEGLRQLTQLVKEAKAPELTYAHIHAVKMAMTTDPVSGEPATKPYSAKSQNPEVEGLRKLAHELRLAAQAENCAVMQKAAYAVKAQRGLMLLREALETR